MRSALSFSCHLFLCHPDRSPRSVATPVSTSCARIHLDAIAERRSLIFVSSRLESAEWREPGSSPLPRMATMSPSASRERPSDDIHVVGRVRFLCIARERNKEGGHRGPSTPQTPLRTTQG